MSLKTIKYAIENNAKVILMSHLGRVKTRVTTSRLRNYESSLDAATDADAGTDG